MKKILYFVSGDPTSNDRKKAAKVGAVFRDALAWHEGDFTEQCDSVMGKLEDVPLPYRGLLAKVPSSQNQDDEGAKEEDTENADS